MEARLEHWLNKTGETRVRIVAYASLRQSNGHRHVDYKNLNPRVSEASSFKFKPPGLCGSESLLNIPSASFCTF